MIPTGERSGLQTRVAAMGSVTLVHAEQKLTAFLELESAICRGFKRVVARSGVPPTSDAIGGGVDAGEALA